MTKFTPPKKLSVVVPVRNEQDNVASLIAEIDMALKGFTHEIVYVNDGSTDQTHLRLKQLQAQYPQLRVVSHAHSCGQSTAVVLVLNPLNTTGSQLWMVTDKMIRQIFQSYWRRLTKESCW